MPAFHTIWEIFSSTSSLMIDAFIFALIFLVVCVRAARPNPPVRIASPVIIRSNGWCEASRNLSHDRASIMRIDHVALWTNDLERCAHFYVSYFGATAGTRYINEKKGFESCFLSFSDGARIEAMTTSTLEPVVIEPGAQRMGLTHFAIALGSDQLVDQLTARLKNDGYPVLDGPRRTGDGYYESVVLDPDGNRIEIAA